MKKIITDSSNFKDFTQRNAYYVDKTPEILELFDLNSNIILMPRPRRFGKTLFLSTLYYLFSNREQDETLFAETHIYTTPFFQEHFGRYPVISVTFKDVRQSRFEDMLEAVRFEINLLVERLTKHIHIDDVECDKTYKGCLNNILHYQGTRKDYENALRSLTEVLTAHYQTPCIVLIDEYDSPVIYAYQKGYYDEAIEFFRNMLGAIFKGNELNIKKALITGILRVSGESMFSGLNNIETITILENELATSCGFTKAETIELLDYYTITGELKAKALTWYNSYVIGNHIITNPWSILNFAGKKRLEPYWANTASNDFIYDLIQESRDFQANLEKLLIDEPIDVRVNKNITFRDKELSRKENLFSLLFFSGYLKCKEKYIETINAKEYTHCKMVPTNVECRMIFETVISSYVQDSFNNRNIEEILQALTGGNIKLFEKLFSYLLRDTVSYFDTKDENSYHMFLLGVLTSLSHRYEILSNHEAGYGRVDIVLLHKTDKTKPAIVMELKEIDPFEEETKETALQKAVEQIKQKAYISLARKRGYGNIIAFGLVFDGKRCWVRMVDGDG